MYAINCYSDISAQSEIHVRYTLARNTGVQNYDPAELVPTLAVRAYPLREYIQLGRSVGHNCCDIVVIVYVVIFVCMSVCLSFKA